MNTTTTLTTLTGTTRLALGAALAALCLGAAACGSEQAADPASSIGKAGSQQQSRISPRAAEHQAELASYGIPVADALGGASWRAREWLGLNATLDEGAPADFVVYDADPRADLTVLARPARVVLRGSVVA
jgi:cytosine/adenosine deaminase-related metal-dependent hydrolase